MGDVIGAGLGLLIILPFLLLWSPLLLIASVVNLFRVGGAKPAGHASASSVREPNATNGDSVGTRLGWVLLASLLFGCFIVVLSATGGRDSGHSRAAVRRGKPETSGDVFVNGYVRDDGTFVSPHFRTRQNETLLDNYSTFPNTNPYTGERGTRRFAYAVANDNSRSVATLKSSVAAPPVAAKTKRSFTFDELSRIRLAADLERMGERVDWRKSSRSQLGDMKAKVSIVFQLEPLGHHIEWRERSLSELQDMDRRIREADEIRKLGHVLDWDEYQWQELRDIRSRIEKARELAHLGVKLDWRHQDFETLNNAVNELRARPLKLQKADVP